MRVLNLTRAAAYSGYSLATIQFYRDYGSLVVIRFDDRSQGIRESELRRWMGERIKARITKAVATEERRLAKEERKRATADRYEKWFARNGLQRVAA